jgi:hypothetical protein
MTIQERISRIERVFYSLPQKPDPGLIYDTVKEMRRVTVSETEEEFVSFYGERDNYIKQYEEKKNEQN